MRTSATQQSVVLPARAAQGGGKTSSSADREPSKYEQDYLPLWLINMLEQVRKTYEEIEELADDIAANGEINAVQVAVYTKTWAQRHLDLVNRLWQTNYQLSDLAVLSRKPLRYAVLISGHRRTLAKWHLWATGCSQCREKYGDEPEGTCFARHFGQGGLVKVSIFDQIRPVEALGMQCRENIRSTVPAHEQADAYDRLFAIMSVDEPGLSVAEFARRVGVKWAEPIRRALRYCKLHDDIKADVEAGRYSYSLALELGRLQQRLGLSEAFVRAERERVISQQITHQAFCKYANNLISTQESGQAALFGLDSLVEAEKAHRRAVFEHKTVTALHMYAQYFRKVKPLLEDGTIAIDGEFLDTSTLSLLLELTELMKVVAEHLQTRRAGPELEQVQQVADSVWFEAAYLKLTQQIDDEMEVMAS